MSNQTAPPVFKIRRASEMPVPDPPSWIARSWLPRNAITVLVGDEGIGKSLFWVTLVMHLTTGKPYPPLNLPRREPADVVVILTEDPWGEVRGRLVTAGADLNRVHVFSEDEDGTGTPVFPDQNDVLIEWVNAQGYKPALIVVDAWLDTVQTGLQVRNPQDARQALAPWQLIAGRLSTAVLLLTHTNRMGSDNPRDLMGATGALRQKARMVLFAARRPDDGQDGEHHLWVGPEKSNTAGPVDAVRFTISVEQARSRTDDDDGTVATLIEAEDAGGTIRQLLGEWRQETQDANKKPTAAEHAEAWLLAHMNNRETAPTKEIDEAAAEAGIGQKAIAAARSNLGTSKAPGFGLAQVFTLKQSPQQSRQREPTS